MQICRYFSIITSLGSDFFPLIVLFSANKNKKTCLLRQRVQSYSTAYQNSYAYLTEMT
jgi:hypothetical protein